MIYSFIYFLSQTFNWILKKKYAIVGLPCHQVGMFFQGLHFRLEHGVKYRIEEEEYIYRMKKKNRSI